VGESEESAREGVQKGCRRGTEEGHKTKVMKFMNESGNRVGFHPPCKPPISWLLSAEFGETSLLVLPSREHVHCGPDQRLLLRTPPNPHPVAIWACVTSVSRRQEDAAQEKRATIGLFRPGLFAKKHVSFFRAGAVGSCLTQTCSQLCLGLGVAWSSHTAIKPSENSLGETRKFRQSSGWGFPAAFTMDALQLAFQLLFFLFCSSWPCNSATFRLRLEREERSI